MRVRAQARHCADSATQRQVFQGSNVPCIRPDTTHHVHRPAVRHASDLACTVHARQPGATCAGRQARCAPAAATATANIPYITQPTYHTSHSHCHSQHTIHHTANIPYITQHNIPYITQPTYHTSHSQHTIHHTAQQQRKLTLPWQPCGRLEPAPSKPVPADPIQPSPIPTNPTQTHQALLHICCLHRPAHNADGHRGARGRRQAAVTATASAGSPSGHAGFMVVWRSVGWQLPGVGCQLCSWPHCHDSCWFSPCNTGYGKQAVRGVWEATWEVVFAHRNVQNTVLCHSACKDALQWTVRWAMAPVLDRTRCHGD
eukprot:364050-Chlamydomonas_euryale.AAC.25